MTHKFLSIFLIASYCIMTGCAQTKTDYVVTFKTEYGDMVAILYDETPKHKANFIKLAKEHYFDSLLFHRVIEEFMIQGGDPDSKHAQPGQHLGQGGPGYTIDAEFDSTRFHEKGALAAARMPDNVNPEKKSSGSQFYIVQGTKYPADELTIDPAKLNQGIGQLAQKEDFVYLQDTLTRLYYGGDMEAYKKAILACVPAVEKEVGINVHKKVRPDRLEAYTTVGGVPHLDDQYTVFGKVIKGLDVIDKIAAVEKDSSDRPVKDVRMTVTVEEMKKKKIEKEYGYHYPDK